MRLAEMLNLAGSAARLLLTLHYRSFFRDPDPLVGRPACYLSSFSSVLKNCQ
jgi:hypothetical protein